MRQNRIKGIVLLAFVLIFCFLSAGNHTTTLEVSEDEIILRFELPEWELESRTINGIEYKSLICSEGISRSQEGQPDLAGFTESAGIPADGNISITVLSSSYEEIDNIVIEPIKRTFLDNEELKYEFYLDEAVYNSNSYFPQQIVRRGNSAFAGDRKFCSIFIDPFQYNGVEHKLRYYEEIIFKINITGSKENFRGASAGSILDKVGDEFLLNNEYSRNWRKARKIDGNSSTRSGEIVYNYMLTIDSEGIYKVSYEYITEQLADYEYEYLAGFSWVNVDPRYLELSNKQGTVPVYFHGDSDGSFDAGDYFEFYADINHGETAWYDDYSTENVFFLTLEDHLGSRMMIENGGIVESNPNDYELPDSFEQTIHIESQNVVEHLGAQSLYDLEFFREDIWFWGNVSAPDLQEFSFDLQYPHASNIRKASASVCLMGLTFDDTPGYYYSPTLLNTHRAIVRINSALVDDIGSNGEWLGQNEQMFENMGYSNSTNPILNTDLSHGENKLSVSVPNLEYENERVLLDYIDLTYWREYKTDTDEIEFHKPILKPIGTPEPMGLYQFDVDGFTSEEISLYKLGSSKFDNLTVTSLSDSGRAPFRMSFQDEVYSDETRYLAITEEMKKTPVNIVPDHNSSLKSSMNGADYVIITVREFGEGAIELSELWEMNSEMQVEVVYVQDIFDEFNNGLRSAESIRDFLLYTYNNWQPRPEYCLLLGEGLLDERSTNPNRWANKIPTKVVWFSARGATASDNWFGCINGDDIVADISISRLNVTQASELSTIIAKTDRYLNQPEYRDFWHSSIVLSTGGKASEGNVFSQQSERIKKNSIPPEYRVTRVYCNIQDMPESYSGNTTTLINAINDGSLYVQFMGHGASHQWDDYDLFDIYDVDNLNNDNLFIASSMSCYGSAFFDNAGESCIGEALTLDPQGAIAHIGFTGFGYLYMDEDYSRALIGALTNPALETIGEIIDYTKIRFYADVGYGSTPISLLHGSALLGDPAVRIIRPQTGTEVTTNKFNYALEDTLILRALVDNDIEQGRFFLYDKDDALVSANEFYPFTYNAEAGEVERVTQIPDASVLPDGEYNRYVKFAGYSQEKEVIGITNFAIGYSGAYNVNWEPQQPGPQDEINVTADFYDPEGVESVSAYIRIYSGNIDPFNESGSVTSYYYEDMLWNEELQIWQLESPISALPYNYCVRLDFTITDSLGNSSECELLPSQGFFRITGVKFKLSDFKITANDGLPAVRVSVRNDGNRASEACSLKLYDNSTQELFDSVIVDSLAIGAQRFHYLTLPMLSGIYTFRVVVNEEQAFPGTATLYSSNHVLQIFEAGIEEREIASIDTSSSSFSCYFPENLLSGNAIFKLEKTGNLEALNQEDIDEIRLSNGEYSTSYQLECLSGEYLADSLGTLITNKDIELRFYYSSVTGKRKASNEDRYSVYKWNDDYQKWVFKSIGSNSTEQIITYETSKTGIYAVYENNDLVQPSIDVNVEGQTFTYGGYVSQNGLLSFLLEDENGVDVIENEIEFFIDGMQIESEYYSIDRSAGNLISIPVKYQLNKISEGIHSLQMSCRDFNGNSFSRELDFEVKADFDVINVANYPNPVKSLTIDPLNTGRTRFTYVLTDDADRVDIKIYTVSGRLVKSFKNLSASIGYHEYPYSNIGWDCRDEKGELLANGIYFYKVTARKSGKSVEKIQKLAILR